MYFIGIDPGQRGAIAVIDGACAVVALHDLPHVNKVLDPVAFAVLLRPYLRSEMLVALEQPAAFCQRAHSMLMLGRDFGSLHATLSLLAVPLLTPTPSSWKLALGVTFDKDVCVQEARRLFPGLPERLRPDKAEALLLAHYAHAKLRAR